LKRTGTVPDSEVHPPMKKHPQSNPHRIGSPLAGILSLALVLIAVFLPFGGCANEEHNAAHKAELQADLEQRNSAYDSYLERRSMRRQARDDRYNKWWDSW
jgi:hypothetical protein